MRYIIWTALVATSFLLPACGGSSGDGSAADGVAVLGTVLSRDGSSDALDGVSVTCTETGQTATTDAGGGFQLHVPPDHSFHLRFDDSVVPQGGPHHEGPAEHHDPRSDGAEARGNEVAVGPIGPGGWCEIEVVLEDGAIAECHVGRWDGDGEEHHGEHHMVLDPTHEETAAVAELEIAFEDDCLTVEVEVEGFSRAATLEVFLVDPGDDEELVATLEVDEHGEGHVEWSWCEGDDLPFGAASPEAFAGYRVVIDDEGGAVVFRGHLPHHHAGDGGHHHHDGDGGPHGDGDGFHDDGDGGHHHGGGPHVE